jgi:putative flippase GtrA
MTVPTPPERPTRRLAEAWRARAIHLKATSFALVGVINFGVDFGIFALCYYAFGLSVISANICAWVVAVSGSYVLNSLITFAAESKGRLRIKDYLAFCLSQTGGLIANTVTVYVLHYFMPVLIAKAFAVGASFVVNFSLSHFVVFRRRDHIH